jgi:hypothetical protein
VEFGNLKIISPGWAHLPAARFCFDRLGALLPFSGDVDEYCQWEVQTDEGWTPYWDPQA